MNHVQQSNNNTLSITKTEKFKVQDGQWPVSEDSECDCECD